MGLPTQEYWSGLPFPSPGDLLDPEIEPDLLHCIHRLRISTGILRITTPHLLFDRNRMRDP